MEKPKCKICGGRHWGLCSPASPTADAPYAAPPSMSLAEIAPEASGFDKRAYQREYMRKRRAAAKGKEA